MGYLELKNITKSYNKKNIFQDFNLKLDKGKFITFVGPYGIGKTTLLKMIAGIELYDNGKITIDNFDPKSLRNIGKIGFSFQEPLLLPWRTVKENIELPCEIYHENKNEQIDQLLKMVDLYKKKNNYPKELSGGMQRIVSILRSLILEPSILLLDEPFSSIDEVNRDEFHEKIIKLHESSDITTILITHSISEAVYLSDEIYLLGYNPTKIIKKFIINNPRKYANKYNNDSILLVNEIKQELRKVINDA